MRTLLIIISVLFLMPSIANAKLTYETPHASPEQSNSKSAPQTIKVETGMDMGLVQELIVTCPNAESGIISYSKAEQVFCSPTECGQNANRVLRNFCGVQRISDDIAGR